MPRPGMRGRHNIPGRYVAGEAPILDLSDSDSDESQDSAFAPRVIPQGARDIAMIWLNLVRKS